jgi:hypothetical protein
MDRECRVSTFHFTPMASCPFRTISIISISWKANGILYGKMVRFRDFFVFESEIRRFVTRQTRDQNYLKPLSGG